jgi:two-component system cell cycle response regulator
MTRANPPQSKIEVLLVEDSFTQAFKARKALENRGASVRHARSGLQALEMLSEALPDIVVSDVLMPEMNGFELCKQIKESSAFCNLPVILLTSLNETREVLRAIECGADNFLSKPYSDEILWSRLQKSLSRPRHQTPSQEMMPFQHNQDLFQIPLDFTKLTEMLTSIYDDAVEKNQKLSESNRELRNSLAMIRKMQQDYQTILHNSLDAMLLVRKDQQILYSNPAALRLFDTTEEQLKEKPFPHPLNPGEVNEILLALEDGLELMTEVSVSEVLWEGKQSYLLTLRDVTTKARFMQELKVMAYKDALTGIYNRRGFIKRANQLLQSERETPLYFGLCFIDMDKMKHINDNFGHQFGDEALQGTAEILQTVFRQEDIVARIGGDEFAVIALGLQSSDESMIRERFADHVRQFNEREVRLYQLSLSLGIVYYDPKEPETIVDLLEKADQLMYETKRKSRSHSER